MEIWVLNKALDRINVVDTYESFLWSPTYNYGGSWELRCPIKFFELLQTDRIIQNTEDDKHNGIIEYIEKITDDEGNENLLVKGKMLEVMLEQHLILGSAVYESVEPAEIIHDLLDKQLINPTDPKRAISNFVVDGNPKADEGIVSFQTEDKHILSAVQSLTQEAQLGFSVIADDEQKKYVLRLYKGNNLTEEDNTTTDVTIEQVSNLLANADFTKGLNGWQTQYNERAFDFEKQEYFGPLPMIASGGVVSKSKVCSIGFSDKTYDIWEPSPHAYQSANLNNEHIYYLAVRVDNQTDSALGFGFKNKGACIFNIGRTSGYTLAAALFVPEASGEQAFYIGLGDLADKHKQFVYTDSSIVIDLTATFGTGNEPDLEYCKNNIYQASDGAWKYKKQTISFVPNANDPLVFSRDRETLIDIEYSKNIVNERNILYVKGDGIDTVIIEGDPTGLNRKESFVNLSSIKRIVDGVEIPEPSYLAMLQREGRAAFRKLVVSELIDGKYYLLSNKKYRKDFDLGDLVNCVDNIGFETTLRITETTEVWDATGYSLSVTLGDDIPDIYETIKLVSKGAK